MSSLSQAQVNRMTNAEFKAYQAAAIARVNAEFGISDSVPPVAKKSGGALLDGSGVAVAAGGAPSKGFQSISIILTSAAVRRKWPFMADRRMAARSVGAAASVARSGDAGAKQSIPHGNHGDNLRSVQK